MQTVKNTFTERKVKFNYITHTLDKIAMAKSQTDDENIIIYLNDRSFPLNNIILDKQTNDFLTSNNFSRIHIYNKNVCDSSEKQYQTYSFETTDGVILQYDKCLRLAPRFQGLSFENTRAIFRRVDTNWIIYIEKAF